MRLDLLNSDGAPLGEGEAVSGEGCPSLDERHGFAKGLDAGEYYLRLQMKQALPLEYRLRVQTP
jgi:hypothetical protein